MRIGIEHTGDRKIITLDELKAFIAKLDLMEMPGDVIIGGKVSLRCKVIELWANDTERATPNRTPGSGIDAYYPDGKKASDY